MPIKIDDHNGNIFAGGNNSDGDLVLQSNRGQNRIHLDAGGGNLWLGGNGADGDLVMFREGAEHGNLAEASVHINGQKSNIFAGGNGAEGDLVLKSRSGENRIHLDAGRGNLWLGGNGADGDLVMFREDAEHGKLAEASIHIDGQKANIFAGGNGAEGDLVLKSADGDNRIRIDAGRANMWIGGNGEDGDIVLFASTGDNRTLSQATIHLNGDAGDIVLQNADCAEDFTVSKDETATLEPGTVVKLGECGGLRISQDVYDQTVVGIIAGAGEYKPGIILGRVKSDDLRLPLALMGRVSCKADASEAPIKVGNLLTTSSIAGHVMKASDPQKAFGAVVGKALTSLQSGQGFVQVLVSLQ